MFSHLLFFEASSPSPRFLFLCFFLVLLKLTLVRSPLHQDAITTLIEQRFDAVSAEEPAETIPTPPHHGNGTNGVKHDHDAEEEVSGEIKVSTSASKKRTSSMVEDEDARLARELQAQENQLARGRQTRGGHSAPKPKSKPKKKSSAKVKSGDDSDVDTEDSGTTKKRKAGGGFQKEFNLSYSLGVLVGAERVSYLHLSQTDQKHH